MKILFATYPMAHQIPGGGEVQITYYKKYLENIGYKIKLFNSWKDNVKNFDIVHFFSCVGGSQHFCNYVKSQKIPLVISPNLWITNKNKNQYNLNEIYNILSLADKIVCNSKIEIKQLKDAFNLSKNKFEFVYNGVDSSFFKKISPNIFKKRYNIKYDFILNVANIEKRKNQLSLLKACINLNQKLIIIGKIRDKDYYNELVAIDKKKILRVIKNISHSSKVLKSAYAACSHFVLPSILETPGLSSIEAAANGKNILITPEGSTREYYFDIVNYCALDLEKSLSEILKLPKYSPKIRNLVKKYLWQRCIVRLDNVYKKLKI